MVVFDENGVLPVGLHACNEDEFRALLVDAFPQSTSRAIIAAGFGRLRSDACDHNIAGLHWIDGSYVTDKVDPDDVDLVTFIDFDLLESMASTPAEDFLTSALGAGPKTPPIYRSDAYIVAVAPAGHPHHASFSKAYDYWRNWFGRMRTLLGPDGEPLPARTKGILQMGLGNTADQPQDPALGGAING